MLIHPIIFNWRNQGAKALLKEQQFKDIGYDNVTVINSDDNFKQKNWINIGEDAYFTKQFLTALEVFDGDVLFHIQADTSYDNWKDLIAESIKHYVYYKWGVYAPNVDWTEWNSARTDIRYYDPYQTHAHVACTDCTCWMIHKSIIDKFLSYDIDMSDQNYGFGIDIIIAACSYLKHRPVIRNYNHTIQHPKGANYNVAQALLEMNSLFSKLPQELYDKCEQIWGNHTTLLDYPHTLDKS